MSADPYIKTIEPLLRSFRSEITSKYGSHSHSYKDDKTIVTELDKQIERSLYTALREQFPDIGCVGEEYGQTGSSQKYWLIDPIDGTELFVRGLPGATSIVGLVEHGQVTHVYIYDPLDDCLYSAIRGQGAYANGSAIQVSTRSVGQAFIGLSTGFEISDNFQHILREKGVTHAAKQYGAGIRAINVATGKIDGLIIKAHNKGGPWDHAPARLLMQEAGARTIIVGEDMVEARAFALLNPVLFDELHDIIEKELYA